MPLEIHIQGFDITNLDSRMQSMARPCYSALINHGQGKPAIIFVPSKKHARQTAVDLWAYASADGKGDKFLQVSLLFVDSVVQLCASVMAWKLATQQPQLCQLHPVSAACWQKHPPSVLLCSGVCASGFTYTLQKTMQLNWKVNGYHSNGHRACRLEACDTN